MLHAQFSGPRALQPGSASVVMKTKTARPSKPAGMWARSREALWSMSRIRTMCRVTVSRQNYPERSKRKDGKGAVGPYCLWQGTINGKRLKKSGMEWTVRGANAITALRCVIQSGRFKEYWVDKAS